MFTHHEGRKQQANYCQMLNFCKTRYCKQTNYSGICSNLLYWQDIYRYDSDRGNTISSDFVYGFKLYHIINLLIHWQNNLYPLMMILTASHTASCRSLIRENPVVTNRFLSARNTTLEALGPWWPGPSWKGSIMTSWHGNTFHITGPLWGESNSHWWISLTKGQQCRPLMISML